MREILPHLSAGDAAGMAFALAVATAMLAWLLQPAHRRKTPAAPPLGRLVRGWQWNGPPPSAYVRLRQGLWGLLGAAWLFGLSMPLWASKVPSDTSVLIRTRTGPLYVPTWVAHLGSAAMLIGLVLLSGMAVVTWRNRSRLH